MRDQNDINTGNHSWRAFETHAERNKIYWYLIWVTISMTFMVIYSSVMHFVYIPELRTEIHESQLETDRWHNRAIELDVATIKLNADIIEYRDALKYEKIFLMFAKAKDILACEAEEKRIRDNLDFCTEKH